ncbi:MAG: 4a-hydroxytetrahydrobiopterin dehydratase [Candidatus Sungbacteria bacterium]|nr:4a-hydroxytetrahydrobiopterin dehydratase [bacterium]MDZ4286200.1 4a-hydroxytetrahydrobiopterin dehydratase [Candidatus Sungbacteria bacterium]
MNMLSKEKCVPCEGDVDPMTSVEVAVLMPDVEGWRRENSKKIWKEFEFKNFVQAVDFINRIADVAEYEDHHPDLILHGYKYVRVELFTHAIKGLSRNDFIVAAKINEIA